MRSLPPIYYIIFTAVTAVGVLLQAFVLLAIFFAVRKAMAKLHEVSSDIKEHALPVIASSRNLIEDISPKLKVTANNLTEVSHTLRHQADHVNETVGALLEKTNAHISRINEMLTGTFDAVDHAARTVEKTVSVPARRVSGIMNGVKTGVEVFMGRKRPASPTPGLQAVVRVREEPLSGTDDSD